MSTLVTSERIELLKKARAAAQAVADEIDRQNRNEIDPDVVRGREATLQHALSTVSDLDEMIENLEASMVDFAIDTDLLEKVTRQAAELDAKIRRNAILNLGIASLTEILNGAASVQSSLG